MDTPVPPHVPTDSTHEKVGAVRKKRQREKIETALRQLETGQYLEGEELDRWLDLYDNGDGPVPVPRRAPKNGAS